MGGSLRSASGKRFNLFELGQAPTFSSAHSLYPGSYAVDRKVGRPWISLGGSTETIEKDLSPDLVGDMEAFPAGWTADQSGSALPGVADNVNPFAGTNSAKLQAGASGVAQYFRDYTYAAGQEVRFVAQLKITSGSGTARFRVQCRETQRWLAPSAGPGLPPTWQDSPVDLFTSSAGAWTAQAVNARLEELSVSLKDEVTLRFFIRCTDNCSANFDAVHSWVTWDVVSIHGHNTDASQAIAVYGGDATPAANLVATFSRPATQPSCYARASSRQTYRFVKVLLPGQNLTPWSIGEAALWQSRPFSGGWLSLARSLQPLQIRDDSMGGRSTGVRLAPARRRLDLTFKTISATAYGEILGELWTRTLEGVEPAIVIPDDERSEVIYGRVLKDELRVTPATLAIDVQDFTLPFVEDALPTVGL